MSGEKQDATPSIASLRSRFESLANESKGLREPVGIGHGASRGLSADRNRKTEALSSGHSRGRTGDEAGQNVSAREQSSARVGDGIRGPERATGPAEATTMPGAPSKSVIPPAISNKPISLLSSSRRAPSPTTAPITTISDRSDASGLHSRTRKDDQGSEKGQLQQAGDSGQAADEDGPVLSVRALTDRFGGSRTVSPATSRAPSPVPVSNPALHPRDASSRIDASSSGLEIPPRPVGSSLQVPSPGVGFLSASPQSLSSTATPVLSQSPSYGFSTRAQISSDSLDIITDAPVVRPGKSAPPPPPSRPATSLLIPSYASSNDEHHRRAAPPPPPPVRHALEDSGPSVRLSRSATTRISPATIPSSSTLSRSATTSRQTGSRPPMLPARKPSLPLPVDGLPPSIPGNRPPASSSPISTLSTVIPLLPARPRGETVSQISSNGPPPPPLPTRSETAPADLPPPPVRTFEASGSGSGVGLTRRVTRKAVPAGEAGVSRSISTRTSARRPTLAPPLDFNDDYQAPPPPTRSAAAATVVPIPTRQTSKDDLESDEDAEEAGPSLSNTAKRLLDDYPDSTHANRRPPTFVPDIRISGTMHTTAFAAHGRHVCTGTHCVKVYDTLMSDHPLFSVDLKDTGLDFRVKENRVTALCFRPAGNEADEGRYLWCGTKDGHLWELDIKTGEITDTRAFVHSSAVAHIFRFKEYIISLEEGGKLHVFKLDLTRDDVTCIPKMCRTLRVQEKFNFAKLVCGRLWTSTGPANRSTTNAASKGPTIRVYDPCAQATTLSGGVTVWPSEWTGAVTSATFLPMAPDTVYLGHEGGYVSVWDARELVCVQVLKISANDILALEGVGDRLWAASRKGVISVYDVTERPWRTTNMWTGHHEHGVHELVVDPFSIQDTGRFVLWSLAKDGLRAWDGLLSVDWVDQQLLARQIEYCSYRQINALICSWNIDSARPADLTGSEDNVGFFPELLGSVDRPDVIVFGFQEVIPLTDKKLTAKTLLFGGKNKDSASSDKISHAYRQWLDKLQMVVHAAYPDTQYVKVHSENMVGLLTCVFVKADERDILRDVDVCTIKRGIGGIYGNKGAIVARLVIDDTSICFINVHLAAGQSAKAARTADLAAIMEDKAVFPPSDALPYVRGGDGTAISDHEMVILNGDLNYRIDQRRENVIASVSAGDLDYLLEHDQLRKEMRQNHAFRLRSFDEAPITFKPTYKYNPGQVEYDSSEKKRIPAWCDRILYSKSDRIKPLHYQRYEPTVSDHRPISAAFGLKVKAVNWDRMKRVRDEVRGQWAMREAQVLDQIETAYVDLK